ncbi:MAG: MBL fold metallo-hydrolase [Nitrososphaerota archaeon]|nr:MBL fold metallo-hydrolase [Nitrososphaerota archaeon]
MMHTKQIGKNIYQVELDTGGFKQLICSYIITGSTPVLIESGPTNSVPNLLSSIQELGMAPKDIAYIAVTHIHLDHGGGAGTLLKALPNAKVLVHPRGVAHLIDPECLWTASQAVLGYVSEVFGKPEPVSQDRIIPITHGRLDLGNDNTLTILETLGHASHNISFYESINGGVFPGDAAGTYLPEYRVVVPTTPPPFYLESALLSLDKLIDLKPTTLYFSHFGPADDAINRLKTYKTQLQLWADITKKGVDTNLSLEEIRNIIIKTDPIMTTLNSYIQNHPIYKKTMLENCIHGFIEYSKTKQQKTRS